MHGGDKFWGINRDEKRRSRQRECQSVEVSIDLWFSLIQSLLRESSRILSSNSRYFYIVARIAITFPVKLSTLVKNPVTSQKEIIKVILNNNITNLVFLESDL